MRTKKKWLAALFGLLFVFVTALAFVGCGEKTKEYTVTFDANGGTLTGDASVKVKEGEKITNAPTAEKAGATFAGWFTAKTEGDEINLKTYEVKDNLNLYAQYLTAPTQEYMVTFNANGGTLTGNATVSVQAGGKIANAPTAEKAGTTFKGWFTAANGGEKVDLETYTVSGNVDLFAQYETIAKTFTATFNPNGGTLNGEGSIEVREGGTITGVPTAQKSGATFDGWFLKDAQTPVAFDTYTVTADVEFIAHYTEASVEAYEMPVNAIEGGYRIEAEDAHVEGTLSSEHEGGFVESGIATASGQKSLGYLGVEGNKVIFSFSAAAAGKATIALKGASNNTQFDFSDGSTMFVADQTVTTDVISVAFNGEEIKFEPATLRGAGKNEPMIWNKYWDPISFGELNVNAGNNTLVITVLATTVPNLDCLDITTTLSLSKATSSTPSNPDVVYQTPIKVDLSVGAYAAGPAIDHAILDFGEGAKVDGITLQNAKLGVKIGGAKIGGKEIKIYLSDENGNAVSTYTSRYVTIEYKVGFNQWGINDNLSPFNYNQQTSRNTWKDLSDATVEFSGAVTVGGVRYNKISTSSFGKKIVPTFTDWKLDGTYTKDDITLLYGAYEPAALKADNGKNALIIWLHGAGEGGTDPSIALLGNQVTNLSQDVVQKYFKVGDKAGAYVLVPQSPTYWMNEGKTDGAIEPNPGFSIYTEALFELIKTYCETKNTDVDLNRIYIGGCSNGGFMTVEMLKRHGEYFAAAYPIATPYKTENITPEMLNKLKDIPIWFTHAQNDPTVVIGEMESQGFTQVFKSFKEINTNELYIKLLAAGAKNVHYSLFANNMLEGVDYSGHYSWIWTLRDECVNVQKTTGTGANGAFVLADLNSASTEKVNLDGKEVTIWGWMAAQSKANS